MNGTNSTWWVPVAAAAIALVGVVVGQLLGAAAESRRHRRETKQRAFEHWRDKKFEAYSEFLRLAHSWHNATILTATTSNEARAEAIYNLHEIREKLWMNISSLRLVSSKRWYGLALEVHQKAIEAIDEITRQPVPDSSNLRRFERYVESIRSILYDLRDLARDEFGIEN